MPTFRRARRAWRLSTSFAQHDMRSIEVQYDVPEFERGIDTLAEIRMSCAHVERLGKIQAFERWAILAMKDKLCLWSSEIPFSRPIMPNQALGALAFNMLRAGGQEVLNVS